MASGFGITGGPGRCYPIWMDFSECVRGADDPRACRDFRDDYLECLHHRREFSRLNAFFREDKRQREQQQAAAGGGGGGGGGEGHGAGH